MKKLEQRLINERRLSDALIVQKKQKELLEVVRPTKEKAEVEDFVPAISKQELKTAMGNSVWFIKHEGNANILNVVVFDEDGSCLLSGVTKAKWKVVEELKVEISADSLPLTGIINLSDKKRFTYQYGTSAIDICEFVGRFTPKKK